MKSKDVLSFIALIFILIILVSFPIVMILSIWELISFSMSSKIIATNLIFLCCCYLIIKFKEETKIK